MTDIEQRLFTEMVWLLQTGSGLRTVRITVHEELVAYLVHEPSDPHRVSGAVEASLRAAHRMVRECGAPDDLLEAVLESSLDAVRGLGGKTSRWIREATRSAYLLLEQFERERTIGFSWQHILERF